ncbi:MAG: xylulose kinase, partial [Propionibacteriales bacterium]|nr:xylulose kinase [Propionibacteriales bacterium]
ARASIEGVLWSLAYGVRAMQELTGPISRITLTGGAAQSPAVQRIATAVFGLPIAVTHAYESVAVGAARQAAACLAEDQHLPDWPVPYSLEREPSEQDRSAAVAISERYTAALQREHLS